MHERMKSPAALLPEAMKGIKTIIGAASQCGLPWSTLHLAHLRISQINGCGFCVDSGARQAKQAGETDDRLFAVGAWRDAPYFTAPERAALELAESVTRLSDEPDAVPDEVWQQASQHYDEKQLAGLLLWISVTNLFNRLNVATRLPAGTPPWW